MERPMRLIPFLVPTLLLAACSQPASPPAETAATSPLVASTAPPDEAPAAGLSPDAVEPAADAAPPPAAPAPAAAADDVRQRIYRVLGDAAQYEAVFIAFQKAVNGGDRAAVVEEVRFPLKIANGATIAGPGEFQRNYERILTPAVRKAIAAQTFDTVMVNQQGVMIGDGQVWLNGACLDTACSRTEVKVVTIQ
jgi:hypothetical protein